MIPVTKTGTLFPGDPVSGMPILNVDRAKSVIVITGDGEGNPPQ